MKKNDIVILIFYIVLTIAMTGYVIKDKIEAKASAVEVYSEGKLVKKIPWPAADQTFKIKNESGFIEIQIKSGKVSVIDADCHDKVCVHTKAIDQGGEMIVCLPHQLYVQIKKEQKAKDALDGFSQ